MRASLRGLLLATGAASLTGCGAFAYERNAIEEAQALQQPDKVGTPAQALAQIDKAIAYYPSLPVLTQLLLGRYQMDIELKQEAAAARDLDRIAKISPRDPLVALVRSDELSANKRFGDALAMVQGALRVNPEQIELLWVEGRLHLQLEHYDDAAASFSAAIEAARVRPERAQFRANGLVGRSVARVRGGNLSAAADDFIAAIGVDRKLAGSAVGELGQLGFEMSLRQIAQEAARRVPSDPGISWMLASIQLASGFPEQALQEIERQLALEPGDWEIDLLWLAYHAHELMSQHTAAMARVKRLLDKESWHLDALGVFVQEALKQDKDDPSREQARRFIDSAAEYFQDRFEDEAGKTAREHPDRQKIAALRQQLATLTEMRQALAAH